MFFMLVLFWKHIRAFRPSCPALASGFCQLAPPLLVLGGFGALACPKRILGNENTIHFKTDA